jgi:hypothetical protein
MRDEIAAAREPFRKNVIEGRLERWQVPTPIEMSGRVSGTVRGSEPDFGIPSETTFERERRAVGRQHVRPDIVEMVGVSVVERRFVMSGTRVSQRRR